MTRIAAVLAAALAAAPAARAAEERGAGTRYDRATFPYGELVNQPLTLPATMVRLDVPVHVNLTKDDVGQPWFVPPSLDVGVTDDVQAGVFHDVGLCLAGAENGCNEAYDDVGLRTLVSLSRSRAAQLALEVNALAYDLEDPQLRAGLALGYRHSLGNVGLQARAGVDVFVTDRDALPYRELIFGEGTGALQLGDGFAVLARIRAEQALEVEDGVSIPFRVPVTLGAELVPLSKLTLGAELEFRNLLGEDATAEERMLVVFLRLFL